MFGKKVANWLRDLDFNLEGEHDGAQNGGWGGSKGKEIKGGTGALSVILSPFTIAGRGVYFVVGTLGFLNGTDDMVGSIKNSDNESLTQSLITDPNYKGYIGNIKTGMTFITFIGGNFQMWRQGIDAPGLIGVGNDLQSLIRDISERMKQKN